MSLLMQKNKMIAIGATGKRLPYRLEKLDLNIPEIQEHEILIKVYSFGINQVDIKTRQGFYPIVLPHILGSEFSGIITKVGKSIKSFSIGDEVMGISFGNCSNGSYSEYIALPYQFVSKKPSSISFELAASIPIAYLSALQVLEKIKFLAKNSTILVAGAFGNVGKAILSLLKTSKDHQIYFCVRDESSKQNIIKNFLVDPNLTFTKKQIEDSFDNHFDCIIDLVGNEFCLDLLKKCKINGHFISLVPELCVKSTDFLEKVKDILFSKSLSMHSIFIGAESYLNDRNLWSKYTLYFDKISRMINLEEINLPEIISEKFLGVKKIENIHSRILQGSLKQKVIVSFI